MVTWLPVQLSAFAFGLLAMGIAYTMARTGGKVPIVSLILSGVITSAIFTALLSIVQMPPGVPVACVGVDGSRNAAALAARILSS